MNAGSTVIFKRLLVPTNSIFRKYVQFYQHLFIMVSETTHKVKFDNKISIIYGKRVSLVIYFFESYKFFVFDLNAS